MGETIIFWIIAVLCIGSALFAVTSRNVFRAALSLILCFITVAGLYLSLSADFLAAMQILIYVGAIGILIILAIMLTREIQRGSLPNKMQVPAIVTAVAFLGVCGFVMLNTPWKIAGQAPIIPTTSAIASKLFGKSGFTLPVEIVPVLLLATILGAIVLAREKK